jgi:hypothetical protein
MPSRRRNWNGTSIPLGFGNPHPPLRPHRKGPLFRRRQGIRIWGASAHRRGAEWDGKPRIETVRGGTMEPECLRLRAPFGPRPRALIWSHGHTTSPTARALDRRRRDPFSGDLVSLGGTADGVLHPDGSSSTAESYAKDLPPHPRLRERGELDSRGPTRSATTCGSIHRVRGTASLVCMCAGESASSSASCECIMASGLLSARQRPALARSPQEHRTALHRLALEAESPRPPAAPGPRRLPPLEHPVPEGTTSRRSTARAASGATPPTT